MVVFAEYIWMDGHKPTQKLRSKTKVVEEDEITDVAQLPDWGLDGSSTEQAHRDASYCLFHRYSCVHERKRAAAHTRHARRARRLGDQRLDPH